LISESRAAGIAKNQLVVFGGFIKPGCQFGVVNKLNPGEFSHHIDMAFPWDITQNIKPDSWTGSAALARFREIVQFTPQLRDEFPGLI
jgi:hypothetical protein